MTALKDVLESLTAFADDAIEKLHLLRTDRVSIEFGCEFTVESGHLIAVIGKASGKSSLKLTLEWARSGS